MTAYQRLNKPLVRPMVAVVGSGFLAWWAGGGYSSMIVCLAAASVSLLLFAAFPSVGWPVVAVGVITGLGAGVQVLWASSSAAGLVPLAALAAGVIVGSALVFFGLRVSRRKRVALAQVLLWGSVVARLAPMSAGGAAFESGTFQGILTGEIGRSLTVIGVGLMLVGVDDVREAIEFGTVPRRRAWGYLAWMMAPGLILVAVMLLANDLGPAAVLSATLAVMTWRALGTRVAVLPLFALGVSALMAATRTPEFQDRMGDASTTGSATSGPATQLDVALRSMGETGFVGGGPGSGAITRQVPAGDSDYILATVGGDYGIAGVIACIVAVAIFSVALLRQSIFIQDSRGIIVTGAATMILVAAIWIAVGNFGVLPFAGIDYPFVGLGGSSALSLGLLLGASSLALGGPDDVWDFDVDTSVITRALALVTVLAVCVVAWKGLNAIPDRGGGRLEGETLYRQRGELLGVDGTVLAYSAGDQSRRYPLPEIALEAGNMVPRFGATGWEFVASGASTCGHYRDAWGQLVTLGIKDSCDPVDVVTTIDPTLQTTISQVAVDHPSTSILVVDRNTNGIIGLTTPEGRLAALTNDRGEAVDELGAEAPFVGEAPMFGPSQARDKNWNGSFAPGSTFKLVTAVAGLSAGLEPPSLGDALEFVDGTVLANSWGGPCNGTSIEDMVAYSCNTTAGWIGETVGAEALTQAAHSVGLVGTPLLAGPADLTRGEEAIVEEASRWTSLGLDEPSNTSASGLARTAIGQQGVRVTVPALAVMASSVLSGTRRPLTFVKGLCQDDHLHQWNVPSVPVDDIDLDPVRAGMRGAVEWTDGGTATSLAARGVIMAKTGTAELDSSDGEVLQESTLVAATESLLIVIRVAPTEENPRPESGFGGAVDVASELLPMEPPAGGDPCRAR